MSVLWPSKYAKIRFWPHPSPCPTQLGTDPPSALAMRPPRSLARSTPMTVLSVYVCFTNKWLIDGIQFGITWTLPCCYLPIWTDAVPGDEASSRYVTPSTYSGTAPKPWSIIAMMNADRYLLSLSTSSHLNTHITIRCVIICVDLTGILAGRMAGLTIEKSCCRGKNTFSYIVMQVIWCLKFCNMTKSGGQSTPSKFCTPPVIYAHVRDQGCPPIRPQHPPPPPIDNIWANDCLEVRGQIIRTVVCVLCTVISTLRWAVRTVLWILGFVTLGPFHCA